MKRLESINLDPKEKVQVGVIVNHNTDSPFAATFEEFALRSAPEGKK